LLAPPPNCGIAAGFDDTSQNWRLTMALSRIKRAFAVVVCAAMVSFSATAWADSGSGSGDDDEERTYLVFIQMNGSLVTVNMGETEIEQRCEQENEFADNNTQICTIVLQ
jgi:hypothetical protein